MKALSRVALAITLCLCVTAPVMGQTPTPIDDPEADLLPEVMVVAVAPGPAWWRISKGESVVWLMSLPASATPVGLKWDQRALERRMTGAKALLKPPSGSITLAKGEKVSLIKFLPGVRWTNGNPEKEMTPELAKRFSAARTRLKKSAGRYASPLPAAAFFMLYGDYLKWGKLELGGVSGSIHTTAKRLKVPVLQPARIRAGDLTAAQIHPANPAAAACYDAMIDVTEVPVERYRTAAAAWARGDLAVATTAPRDSFGICENRLFNQGAGRKAIEAQVTAIETALKTPGKTVAVANLRSILAEDGIVDRLRRDGYTVIGPGEVTD